MRIDTVHYSEDKAEVYNDDVNITLSALIQCTLEEEDITTWINSCQSEEMIDNIIRATNKRKKYFDIIRATK